MILHTLGQYLIGDQNLILKNYLKKKLNFAKIIINQKRFKTRVYQQHHFRSIIEIAKQVKIGKCE
jgi:hypothetical protein